MTSAVRDRLEAHAGSPWPGKVIVLPYPVPEHNGEEDCCNGLILAVIERIYLTEVFPNEAVGINPCDIGQLAVDVTLSTLRCAPKGNRTGYVDAAALNAVSAQVWEEAELAWWAVQCLFNEMVDLDPFFAFAMRNQVARPNDEGCVGTDLSVTFAIQNRCNCG